MCVCVSVSESDRGHWHMSFYIKKPDKAHRASSAPAKKPWLTGASDADRGSQYIKGSVRQGSNPPACTLMSPMQDFREVEREVVVGVNRMHMGI